MQIILSHSGKQHAYQVAKALKDMGHLHKFYTSSYINNKLIQTYLTRQNNTFWSRRFISGVGGSDVDANWRFELKELVLRKLQGKSYSVQKAVYERDVNFDAYVAMELSKYKNEFVFWGFQGSCYRSLQAANAKGMLSICELATAHVTEAKNILGEERELMPAWEDSIDNLVFPSAYEKRLIEEPHIAQRVIGASSFTRQSLLHAGIQAERIDILPLGFDIEQVTPKHIGQTAIQNRPLKLLYAGTVTQRKGIAYLLEAMKSFKREDVELHIIGGVQGNGKMFASYKELYIYHQPVSQAELLKQYKNYDALVLPSLFEGFGLVIVEAMAAGLPVITTAHTIGPDIIDHMKDGIIIPIRNVKAIQDSIIALRSMTDADYNQMSMNARDKALSFSWTAYQKRLAHLCQSWKSHV